MAAPMKWYRDGGEGMVSSAKIAGIEITAGVGDEHAPVRATLVSTSDMLGHAEQRAEQALREMHDVLSKHFAPVLRWSRDERARSIASISGWCLCAWSTGWEMRHETIPSQSIWFSFPFSAGEAQARRAAENALRSFGVVFRTEGE